MAHVVLFLLFGFGHIVHASGSTLCFDLAVGLSLGNLTRYSFAPAPARLPLGLLFLLLLILLIGRLGNFDNYLATVELLLIKSLDSFLCGLCAGYGDETIAR